MLACRVRLWSNAQPKKCGLFVSNKTDMDSDKAFFGTILALIIFAIAMV